MRAKLIPWYMIPLEAQRDLDLMNRAGKWPKRRWHRSVEIERKGRRLRVTAQRVERHQIPSGQGAWVIVDRSHSPDIPHTYWICYAQPIEESQPDE